MKDIQKITDELFMDINNVTDMAAALTDTGAMSDILSGILKDDSIPTNAVYAYDWMCNNYDTVRSALALMTSVLNRACDNIDDLQMWCLYQQKKTGAESK